MSRLGNRLQFWALAAAAILNLSALVLSFHGLTLSRTDTSLAAKAHRFWRNDHNVVHVVHTRFQQHQPSLVHLGRARLALFNNFCLRTVSQQTSRQFLWIIRADPMLEPELKKGLIDLVRGQGNIMVVGSNSPHDNVPFRSTDAISDINTTSLWHGRIDVLKDYHDAAQTRTVIETGLDADDGLALSFVSTIQRQAASLDPHSWRIWCISKHTEWHVFAPFKNYPMKDSGYVRSVDAKKLKICVTPGLSRSMGPGVHDRKGGVPKPSQSIDDLGNHFFEKHDSVRTLPRCTEHRSSSCWQFLTSAAAHEAQAIRSRTPTSAGMKGLALPSSKVLPQSAVLVEAVFWNDTMQSFSLDGAEIRQRRMDVLDDLSDIVLDAIRGQCTLGHSCKASSVQRLQDLMLVVPSLAYANSSTHVSR